MIELILVIAIISIMSAVVIVSVLGNRPAKQTEAGARLLASAIRQAQNFALSGKQDGANPSRKVCGYGVYFDNNANQYKIFYNFTGGATTCETFNQGNSLKYDASKTYSADYLVQTLPPDVMISAAANQNHLYFTAPFGNAYYNGVSLGKLTLTLKQQVQGNASFNLCLSGRGNVVENGTANCP